MIGGREAFPAQTPSNSQTPAGCLHNSIQFWHYLPGDSIRPHKSRAQSYRTTSPTASAQASSKFRLLPVLLTKGLQIGGSNKPHSGSISLLERLRQIRETFYLLYYQFLAKGRKAGTAKWKPCIGHGMGKGHKILFPNLHVFTSQEVLWSQSPGGLMEASLLGHDWLAQEPLRTEVNLQLFPPSLKPEGGRKVPTPNYRVVPLATRPLWAGALQRSPH